tara:strand:+ start:3193 stop:3327 length:135 start_codon:yes stop_codon:yes gene_type:complete
MSIEALIGFIVSVALATAKFNDKFEEVCKGKREKDKHSPKKCYL